MIGHSKAGSAVRRAPRWALLGIVVALMLLGCQVLFGGVTVEQANATDAACNLGDLRCNGEYLLSCAGLETGWSLKDTCASGDLCDAKDGRCSVCKDGDFRCSGVDRQQCTSDGSGWKTIETCSAQNLCSESSCNGCVTNGQLDCSLGSQLRQCQAGVWVTLDDCASHTLCTDTTAYATTTNTWNQKCVAPGCAEAGKYQCDGTILKRCPPERDALVTVDTCNTSALCEAAVARVNSAPDPNSVATLDMCKPACPTPGAFFCNGSSLQQCRDDQTAYDPVKDCPAGTECDPVAGDCGQLCTPGQYQCNDATLRKCGSDGHWADQAQCESAALCSVSSDAKTGACTPSPCGNNDYTCSGAVLQKCKADRTGYEDNMTCASATLCEATSARCIAPTCETANAYRCFGQDLKQCSADLATWNAITTCPDGQYCDSGQNPGCLTQCPANPLRCNGNVLEHCAAATGWTTQATCTTNDLCNCALTDPDGPGPLTNSCLNGLYKDGCGNVVCGAPLAGYQCSGADLQKCQAGRNGWDKVSTCDAANLCYAGESPGYTSGYCLACPTAGELSCSGNTLRVCSSDRRSWNTSQTCSLGCMPLDNAQDYCAACKAGTTQCAGQTLQSCPADQKAYQTQQCANVCDAANNQCDQCAANTYWCDGASLDKCSADGQSQTTTACGSTALCNAAGKKCDACLTGQHQCKGSNAQICSADKSGFVNSTDCGAAGCNASTNSCYACATGQHQCKGSNSQVCSADKSGFVDGTDCGTPGCNATSNNCNACTAGQHKCKGANSQVCSSDKSGFVDDTDCGAPGCNTTTNSCNVCAAGQHKCKGNNAQICSADQSSFVDDTDCGTAGCNTSTNQCNPMMICSPMAYQCAGSGGLTLQQCNAAGSAWTTLQTCPTICDAAHAECDECVAPAFDCAMNVLRDCSSSGHWETKQDCKTATCNPAGTCDANSGGGGASSGGASNGGAASAGANNGGASNAGAANGGAANGGASSGGASNAGAANGGAANGGAANGGTAAGP